MYQHKRNAAICYRFSFSFFNVDAVILEAYVQINYNSMIPRKYILGISIHRSGYHSRYGGLLRAGNLRIESRWTSFSPTRPHRFWSPPSFVCHGFRIVFSPGVKWQGRDLDRSVPSSAEVKERVELYLYSFSVPLCKR